MTTWKVAEASAHYAAPTRPKSAIAKAYKAIFVVIGCCALFACGGGGGGGGGTSNPPPPPIDVAGIWQITENHTDNCEDGTAPDVYTATVTQNGSTVVVTADIVTRTGTLSGSTLVWSGSYPEENGTTTVSNLTLTFSGNSVTGTSTWSWIADDGSFACNGTSTISGQRISGGSTPSAPTGLTAQAVSATAIALNWSDVSDEDSYTIQRSLNSGTGFTTITTVSANVTSYSDSGLTPNTTYYYRVFASNSNGNSGFSNEASAQTEQSSTTPADFAGIWHIRETVDATNCGEGVYLDAWTAQVSQTGVSISILDSAGDTYQGTVSGNTASWTGSFPDDGGTTTITSLTLTISGDTISGSSTWTWTNGVDNCSGTTQIQAQRNGATQEIEPNDEPAMATALSPSNGAAFRFGTVNDLSDGFDVWAFTLNAGGIVEFELSHFDLQSQDLDLGLFDQNLNLVAISETGDSFEIVAAQVQAGVVYYIAVFAFETGGQNARYELSMDVN